MHSKVNVSPCWKANNVNFCALSDAVKFLKSLRFPKITLSVYSSVVEPCHFAYVPVPVPGPNFFSPRFRFRFWFLPLNFKLFLRLKLLPVTMIFVSSIASFLPVSCQSRYNLIFFVQQEPEPEPEPRARIRFRFFLGQNDTVPSVPVPVLAPVPQHWFRVNVSWILVAS